MTIRTASKRIYKLLTAVGLIAALTACGGGGGDNKDSTPDAFSFPAVPNVEVSTEVSSAAVSVTGINQTVAISITGGTYSVGGGAFTSAAGTVSNGQSVTVKVTSSATTNTAAEAVLTIGGVTGNFKVTTKLDVTPDNFSFSPATEVVPNAVSTSAPITVAGIDTAVPIIISGTATKAEYSINDAPYTAAPGTVSKNQTVKVRGTAAATTTTSSNVVLTIGGVSGTYKITTLADTVAPTAQILFPPPVSMTEGNTILVRGTASDDYSTVVSVKVNGVVATTTDGYKNWQASVPLTDNTTFVTKTTENTLTVTTKDSAGNESTNAAHVAIKQSPLTSAFPDDVGTINPWGLALDQVDGRNRLLVVGASLNVYAVDLTTGIRTLVTTLDDCKPMTIVVSSINKHAYTPCGTDERIVDIDLSNATQFQTHAIPNFFDLNGENLVSNAYSALLNTKNNIETMIINYQKFTPERLEIFAVDTSFTQFNLISNSEKLIPDSVNPIRASYGIALDKNHNRYLVPDIRSQTVFAVDETNGARSIFSANTKGSGVSFADVDKGMLSGITVDEANDRALVAEFASSTKIFSIDLASGNRSLLSSTSEANPFNSIIEGIDIKIFDSHSYAFICDGKKTVFAIDLVTGHRVIFSKSIGQ